MSFFRHEQIYHPMRRFLLRGRLLFRLRPRNSSSDESAASYSLAGCTPALPASALPAVVNPEPAGWNCQPPPHKGWGISDRRYGEFSTGVDTIGFIVAAAGLAFQHQIPSRANTAGSVSGKPHVLRGAGDPGGWLAQRTQQLTAAVDSAANVHPNGSRLTSQKETT